MEGLLLVDKPKGISSFGVVARVRWIIKNETGLKIKIGHSGTLDPLATGLLVLALGSYTKKISELIKKDKTYEVEVCLGEESVTGDEEGQKTFVSDLQPSLPEIKAVLRSFTGEIMQTPPVYSAIKINGQPAYKLARKGLEPNLKPRPVTIYSLDSVSYVYPKISFIAKVSSGTYIRSLAEDIGKALKTGAYMSNLRRTAVGQFNVHSSLALEDINIAKIEGSLITLEKRIL
jgi:tRNA pseudouridine55 synthase